MHKLLRFLLLLSCCAMMSCSQRQNSSTAAATNSDPRDAKATDAVPKSAGDSNGEQAQGNQATSVEQDRYHFEEIAQRSGVQFTPRTGNEAGYLTILESLGTGVGMIDFDRDGWLDIFFVGGGTMENRQLRGSKHGLFRNTGGSHFTDSTDQAKLVEGKYYSHGVIAGDYDNDGFEDLIITGYGGLQVLRNQGDGTFMDSELPGVEENAWSAGVALADFNGDQLLDLYVSNYTDWSWENSPICSEGDIEDVCPPRRFEGLSDSLYFNNGDGSFRNVTQSSGLVPQGKGMGVLAFDRDQDRDMDIYVANDTVANFLYLNDGQGKMEEVASERGAAIGGTGAALGSMGVAICDYNNDGAFDIWVTNFAEESSALYKSVSGNFFQHSSFMVGVEKYGGHVGWGTAWSDFDFDGDEDVVVINGHVFHDRSGNVIKEPPQLMVSDSQRLTLIEPQSSTYFASKHWGRGLAVGDLDNDGDQDLVVTHTDQPVAVLRNDVQKSGDWICVELIGRNTNRFAIGAILTLKTNQGTYLRQITSGGSYLSANDRRVFWGLPAGSVPVNISIQWPSGARQVITDVQRNQPMKIIEPAAAAGDAE